MSKVKKVLTSVICLLSSLALVSCDNKDEVVNKEFYVENFQEIEVKKDMANTKETYFSICYDEIEKDNSKKTYCTVLSNKSQTLNGFIFKNNLAYQKVNNTEGKEVLVSLKKSNFTEFNYNNVTVDNTTFIAYFNGQKFENFNITGKSGWEKIGLNS